jgi:hypothetical protein
MLSISSLIFIRQKNDVSRISVIFNLVIVHVKFDFKRLFFLFSMMNLTLSLRALCGGAYWRSVEFEQNCNLVSLRLTRDSDKTTFIFQGKGNGRYIQNQSKRTVHCKASSLSIS